MRQGLGGGGDGLWVGGIDDAFIDGRDDNLVHVRRFQSGPGVIRNNLLRVFVKKARILRHHQLMACNCCGERLGRNATCRRKFIIVH
jgi:hypothetical protein